MQFGRTLAVVLALVIALGSSWLAPVSSAEAGTMAMGTHAAMTGMDAPSAPCDPCTDEAGMMQDCLASACVSFTATAQHDVVAFAFHRPSYGALLAQFASGVAKRPDPYPPRPTIPV